MDDLTLLERAGGKDLKAQEEFYKRYYAYGMSICLRYSRSREEAQEVLNDAFFKIFTKAQMYSYHQSVQAWLRRIFINSAIDYYRRQKKHYHHLNVEDIKEEGADPQAIDLLSVKEIYALVQTLPDIFRLTFNLYQVEGYSHEEISQMLDIPVGTSRSNLSRAKRKLRQMIQARDETPIR
ncbi:MAG: RNA polymerase sigma factor [Bernardetiaceae bacterium]